MHQRPGAVSRPPVTVLPKWGFCLNRAPQNIGGVPFYTQTVISTVGGDGAYPGRTGTNTPVDHVDRVRLILSPSGRCNPSSMRTGHTSYMPPVSKPISPLVLTILTGLLLTTPGLASVTSTFLPFNKFLKTLFESSCRSGNWIR